MPTTPSGPTLFFRTTAERSAYSSTALAEGQIAYDQESNEHLYWDGSSWQVLGGSGPGGGAPTDADYLVGTANGDLSAEIVVGTTPGGELGGTWASPTVDATHAGSTHSAATDTHIADATDAHDASAISVDPTGLAIVAGDDVQEAIGELDAAVDGLSSGGGAPANADYLVGTADATLSNEIVVGTTPGGELGGTWASPTVDATHSGSAHHTQSHDHSAAGDGTTLTPATLNLPTSAAPSQTTDGRIVWDSDDNWLTVGDGAATKIFLPTIDATSDPLPVSTAAADGTEASNARKDHVHAHEAAHINHDTTWAAKGDLITGTANDTAAITSVGANDTILMADSAQAGGVKWVASAAPVAVSTANAEGTSDDFSRASHVHAHETAHCAHDTVWAAAGDVLVGTANDTAAVVGIGSTGQVATVASGTLAWQNPGNHVTFSKSGNLSTGTGTLRWYNDLGRAVTIFAVRASVGTAPATQSIIIDVNENGTTMYTTQGNRPTIAASSNTTDATLPDDTSLADNNYITIDIDQVGSGTVGADLTVTIWYR